MDDVDMWIYARAGHDNPDVLVIHPRKSELSLMIHPGFSNTRSRKWMVGIHYSFLWDGLA